MCDHRIANDPTGLLCVRADEHQAGHVYFASDSPQIERDEEVCR